MRAHLLLRRLQTSHFRGALSHIKKVSRGVFTALLLSSSCGSKKAVVVVGVQSEPMGGLISIVHIVVRVAGVVVKEETLRRGDRAPLAFPRPWEARLSSAKDGNDEVEVEVDAFDAARPETPLLTRHAETHFVPGREMLLRLSLEARCIVYPSPPRPPGSPPGPLNGPTCEAPTTCIRGSCQSSIVVPTKLESYAPSWSNHTPDVCKSDDGGSPSVSVGTGQTRYASLSERQVLWAEPGPQGGHHLWIAVRMRNLSQRSSTTTLSAVQPGSGTAIPPSAFAFELDPDEEGYCQLYGLRYQLDNGGIDYTQFLGKPLEVTATVIDSSGAKATAIARVEVAKDLAVPNSTPR
jgi:hypothetical protein